MYFEYKHNRHLMSMQEVYQYDCVLLKYQLLMW